MARQKQKAEGSEQLAVDSSQLPVGSEQLAVDSSQLPVGSEQLAVDSGELMYEVGEWKGLPHYVCKRCKFDSLKLEVIEGHVEKHLVKTPATLTPALSLEGEGVKDDEVFEVELKEIDSAVDKDGNEIKTFTVKEN